MSFWSALASVAGNVIGGLFNKGSQDSANKTNMEAVHATNQANKELAEYYANWNKQENELAFQRDLQMMDKYNAYNAPAAQMERLTAAGLNPNLVYGSGNVAGNQSGQASYTPAKAQSPTMQAPRISAYTGWNLGVSDAIRVYQQDRLQSSQIKNMEAQNDYIKQQTISEGLKQANTAAQTARSQFDLGLAKKLEETSIEAAKANLDKIHNENTKIGTETALNMARASLIPLQKEMTKLQMEQVVTATAKLKQDMDFARFEQDLKRIGIYPSDSLFARIIGRLFGKGQSWLDGLPRQVHTDGSRPPAAYNFSK